MASKVYFMYSPTQVKVRKETELKLGKEYSPGIIIKSGRRLYYSEVSSTGRSVYSDSKVVYYGDPNKIEVIKKPGSEYGSR